MRIWFYGNAQIMLMDVGELVMLSDEVEELGLLDNAKLMEMYWKPFNSINFGFWRVVFML